MRPTRPNETGRHRVLPRLVDERHFGSVGVPGGPFPNVSTRPDCNCARWHVFGDDGIRTNHAPLAERESEPLLGDDARAGTDRDTVLDDDAHTGPGVWGAGSDGHPLRDHHTAPNRGVGVDDDSQPVVPEHYVVCHRGLGRQRRAVNDRIERFEHSRQPAKTLMVQSGAGQPDSFGRHPRSVSTADGSVTPAQRAEPDGNLNRGALVEW